MVRLCSSESEREILVELENSVVQCLPLGTSAMQMKWEKYAKVLLFIKCEDT